MTSSAFTTIGSFLLFCLHSRWELPPVLPSQPLGASSCSAFTAVGSFLLFCLHSRWELPPLLPSQPLGASSCSACSTVGSKILVYVLFHLHSRWEASLPPDPPLGQNITCVTSSTVTAVGSFLLCGTKYNLCDLIRCHSHWEFSPLPPHPLLGHVSLVQPLPLSQPLGVSSSSACSTVGLHKSRPCRFSVGASRHPVTPAATRRHCIGLAVERLLTGRERLTLHRTCCGEAIDWQGETDTA